MVKVNKNPLTALKLVYDLGDKLAETMPDLATYLCEHDSLEDALLGEQGKPLANALLDISESLNIPDSQLAIITNILDQKEE